MDWLTFISGIIVALIGAGILFYGLERKKRHVEMESVTVKTLNEAIETLSKRSMSQETLIRELRNRVDLLEKESDEMRDELTAMKLEKGNLEIEVKRHKASIERKNKVIRMLHGLLLALYKQIKDGLGKPRVEVPPLCDLLEDE